MIDQPMVVKNQDVEQEGIMFGSESEDDQCPVGKLVDQYIVLCQ